MLQRLWVLSCIIICVDAGEVKVEQITDALEKKARVFYEKKDYEGAIDVLVAGLSAKDEASWVKTPTGALLIGSYKAQGKLYAGKMKLREALPFFQNSLRLNVQRHGEDDASCAVMRHEIARIYSRVPSKRKEALQMLNKNLAVFKDLPVDGVDYTGVNHAETLVAIANLYEYQGNYEEAIEQYEKALTELRGSSRAGGEEVAVVLGNLGIVLRKDKQLEKAMTTYEEAADLYEILEENTGGAEQAIIYRWMSKIASDKEDWEETAVLLQRAYEIQLAKLDDKHVEIANTLTEMGIAHWRRQSVMRALKNFQQALNMREGLLGPESLECGLSKMQIGSLFIQLGQWQQALKYCTSSYKILAATAGQDDPRTKTAKQNAEAATTELGKKLGLTETKDVDHDEI
jgi:tetratricopeptide (TPR) repeat protein